MEKVSGDDFQDAWLQDEDECDWEPPSHTSYNIPDYRLLDKQGGEYTKEIQIKVNDALSIVVSDRWREILRNLSDRLAPLLCGVGLIRSVELTDNGGLSYTISRSNCLTREDERSLELVMREKYGVTKLRFSYEFFPTHRLLKFELSHPTLDPFSSSQ